MSLRIPQKENVLVRFNLVLQQRLEREKQLAVFHPRIEEPGI